MWIARVLTLLLIGADDAGSGGLAAQNDSTQVGFRQTRLEWFETLRRHVETFNLALEARVLPGQTHAGHDWVSETQRFFAGLRVTNR